MSNPFIQNDLEILKEAFPTLPVSVIDDTLRSCRGEVNQAFEMLLSMSDPTQLSPPPLPNRPNSFPNPSLNPFTQQNNAKPLLTVREELAQWRQDLVTESRRRAEEIRKANSQSDLSFSNLFRSSSSQIGDRRRTSNHHAPPSISVPCFQSPVTYSTTHHSSTNTIGNNYTTTSSHHRSNSNPSTRYQPSVAPPALPVRRRQSSNSVNACNRNNPFLSNDPIHRPSPAPLIRQNNENEASFNPFEEPEQPPPAYNEIQKDTIINLSP